MSAHCDKCGLAKFLPGLVKSLTTENAKLTEQVEAFRAALEFYGPQDKMLFPLSDRGDRAREVLAKFPKRTGGGE